MAWDSEFVEGFDKYGPVGCVAFPVNTVGEWTITTGSFNTLVTSLNGISGCACQINNGTMSKTLSGNYARVLGGCRIKSNLLTNAGGFQFLDGVTAQISIIINTLGQIVVYRGGTSGTVLATSTQTIAANTVHYLEWDITFNSLNGIVNIYLDGTITSIALTGVNTQATTNSSFDVFVLTGVGGSTATIYDDMYLRLFLAAGSADTCLNNNPVIATSWGTADSSVQFTPENGVVGQVYSTTTTTSAPGANELALRQFTPAVASTVNSIGLLPAATNAAVNFKGVIYSDSGGTPHTLLSSGTQVTGCTSGTSLTLPLVTPQALSAGTPYWIGYITDTSIALTQVDATTNAASKAANTYTSGAPGTAPAMTTGQPSWQIWGNVTGMTTNWSQVGNVLTNPPLGDLSYNQANVAGKEDLYTFPALPAASSTVATVAVKSYNRVGTPGVRSVSLQTKSGSTDSSGSGGNQNPATSYNWMVSYFDVDPNGSAPWTVTGVNNATSGIKVQA